jgi:hypothetical protein
MCGDDQYLILFHEAKTRKKKTDGALIAVLEESANWVT